MATIAELVPGVVRFLVQVARERRLTTYGEVAHAVGTHHRVVPKVLEIVRDLCIRREWPPLTALVVRADQGRPGEAFLDPWVSRDTPQAVKNAMVDEFIQQVYTFDWAPLLGLYPQREAVGAVAATAQGLGQAVSVILKLTQVDRAVYLSSQGFHTLVDRRPGSPYCHADLYDRLKALLVAAGQWEE